MHAIVSNFVPSSSIFPCHFEKVVRSTLRLAVYISVSFLWVLTQAPYYSICRLVYGGMAYYDLFTLSFSAGGGHMVVSQHWLPAYVSVLFYGSPVKHPTALSVVLAYMTCSPLILSADYHLVTIGFSKLVVSKCL